MSGMPRAMVLAAGLGLRMRPLTSHLPKALLPVSGQTLLDRALDWLKDSGVEEAVVNTFYLAEMVETHLRKRTSPRIHISREEVLLETGGGIRQALPLLEGGPFFSVNSDTITLDGESPALRRLLVAWDENRMDALLLLHPVEKAVGYEGQGDFFLNGDGSVRRRLDAPSAPLVFTGVQLLHPRLFVDAPDGAFSLNVLYNRGARENGTLPRIHGLIHDGHWLHVGDPQGLAKAEGWLAAWAL